LGSRVEINELRGHDEYTKTNITNVLNNQLIIHKSSKKDTKGSFVEMAIKKNLNDYDNDLIKELQGDLDVEINEPETYKIPLARNRKTPMLTIDPDDFKTEESEPEPQMTPQATLSTFHNQGILAKNRTIRPYTSHYKDRSVNAIGTTKSSKRSKFNFFNDTKLLDSRSTSINTISDRLASAIPK
jgi:hypothetical protein